MDSCATLSVGRHAAAVGNALVFDRVRQILDGDSCPVKERMQWADMDSVMALTRGVVSPKRLAFPDSSARSREYICVLVAQVCFSMPVVAGVPFSVPSLGSAMHPWR
jgi:hypothetical protein